ncbi:MAG: ribosome silencing factor [Eubacterium sp.]|nr:ribosome silencing factor [Eubacterium sp.]
MTDEKVTKMINTAVDAILDRKGYNVVNLSVGEVSVIADNFVIATASNKSQLDAIIDKVEEGMRDNGFELKNREGRSIGGWVLLDYSEVVIHLFLPDMRDFYGLDGTWRDVTCEKFD